MSRRRYRKTDCDIHCKSDGHRGEKLDVGTLIGHAIGGTRMGDHFDRALLAVSPFFDTSISVDTEANVPTDHGLRDPYLVACQFSLTDSDSCSSDNISGRKGKNTIFASFSLMAYELPYLTVR